jgi:O-antigen/teichoic acid export membrane protein
MFLGLLPPIIAAHASDISRAGYVALGLLVSGAASSFFTPIAVTLLPVASTMVARQSTGSLRKHVLRFELLMIAATLVIALGAGQLGPLVTQLILGRNIPEASGIIGIAAIGAGPYAYFSCVRTIIDAATERAVVTRCVVIALLTFSLAAPAGMLLAPGHVGTVVISAYVLAQVALASCAGIAVRHVWGTGR